MCLPPWHTSHGGQPPATTGDPEKGDGTGALPQGATSGGPDEGGTVEVAGSAEQIPALWFYSTVLAVQECQRAMKARQEHFLRSQLAEMGAGSATGTGAGAGNVVVSGGGTESGGGGGNGSSLGSLPPFASALEAAVAEANERQQRRKGRGAGTRVLGFALTGQMQDVILLLKVPIDGTVLYCLRNMPLCALVQPLIQLS